VCNAIAPGRGLARDHRRRGPSHGADRPRRQAVAGDRQEGPNVRLASQLTGWRIDIHSESKIYELERRAKEQISQAIDTAGFDTAVADTLFKLGWRSVGELGRAHVEELAGLPASPAPTARAGSSTRRSSTWHRVPSPRHARKEAERRGHMSGTQQLLELDGVDQDVLNVLATANIHSPEDLIKTPIESIATTTGIDMGDLARLRQRRESAGCRRCRPDRTPSPSPSPSPSAPARHRTRSPAPQ